MRSTVGLLLGATLLMAAQIFSVDRFEPSESFGDDRVEHSGHQEPDGAQDTSANDPRHLAVDKDWPRWRGPRGNGTWQAPPLPERWPGEGLNQRWEMEIGGGYAGVTVGGGRVYTMDRQEEPREVERVLCFDAETGELLWSVSDPVEYDDLQYGNGPRAAPTLFNGRVYTLGALGMVNCLDAVSGKRIWSRHLVNDDGGRVPMWGYAASPFVYENLIILQPGASEGGSILAVQAETGKTVWKALSDEAAYATPLLLEHRGTEQLVCWTPSHIRSLDPRNGRSYWSVPYEVTYGVSIATPVYHRGMVFVSGYWEGSKAIRLGDRPEEAEPIWEENRFLRGLMSQPLCRGDHVYLLDKRYGLTCFELETGEKLWDDENRMTPRDRNPHASLVWLNDGDRIIVLNSEGDLILARINPDGYHEQSRTNIIGSTWAHPAFAGQRVYARSDTKLVCVELPVTASHAQ